MTIRRYTLLASLVLAAPPITSKPVVHSGVASAVADSLRIFYIGRPAGWEHYELEPAGSGLTLTSDYDYVDRGRRNHTQLAMDLTGDYALRSFEIARVTDTSRTVGTAVRFDGGRATTITRGGKSNDVAIPSTAYVVTVVVQNGRIVAAGPSATFARAGSTAQTSISPG